jgi:hypothetical protein
MATQSDEQPRLHFCSSFRRKPESSSSALVSVAGKPKELDSGFRRNDELKREQIEHQNGIAPETSPC